MRTTSCSRIDSSINYKPGSVLRALYVCFSFGDHSKSTINGSSEGFCEMLKDTELVSGRTDIWNSVLADLNIYALNLGLYHLLNVIFPFQFPLSSLFLPFPLCCLMHLASDKCPPHFSLLV